MSEGAERIIIPLELKDNHFEFCGSSTSENNRSSESKNNCLYEALSGAIPGLRDKIAPEKFRAEVANCIERDKGIQYHIQQGWHQLPMSLGAFGGASARKRSKVVHDIESSCFDNEGSLDYKEYRYRKRKVSDHLQDRLKRFVRLAGIDQRMSKQTNGGEIFGPGPSQHQDQSSNKGKGVHAAHLVRVVVFDCNIEKLPEPDRKEIVNYVGHTQNVPKYANEWHGIGGDIDKFQSENLIKLKSIDFSGSLTAEGASTMKDIKEDFIAVLDNRINGGNLGDREKSELIEAKTALTNTTIESLFEKGKKCYSGEDMDVYR
jgi:hypothetical protein